jgi:magnesium-transporting ATPase (P-type)
MADPHAPRKDVENAPEMTYLGLLGIYDPPREGEYLIKHLTPGG